MSFRIELDKYEKAYGRLVRRVQSAIQETFEQETSRGLTQADMARELKLDPSIVSRRINGSGNLTLRSISDLFVAMNRDPLANFEPLEVPSAQKMVSVNSAAMIEIGAIVCGGFSGMLSARYKSALTQAQKTAQMTFIDVNVDSGPQMISNTQIQTSYDYKMIEAAS
jgi:transcriptional regulator with XRE-family HTH domain